MTWRDLLSWLASLLRKTPGPAEPAPSPSPKPPPATSPSPRPDLSLSDVDRALLGHLLELHSGTRESTGLPRLAIAEELFVAAVDYARRMALSNELTHDLGPGLSFKERLRRSGYPAASAGENIAAGQPDAPRVFSAWMRSNGHRSNILNPAYRECGFGTAVSSRGVRYWCAIFGGRRRSAAAAEDGDIWLPATLWFANDPEISEG